VTKKPNKPATFSAGDIVRLKIGGPQMMVYAVKGTQITCDWAKGDDLRRRPFNKSELVLSAGESKTHEERLEELLRDD
jgi:uncharacterized protein YodC (DUF2158 family)